MRETIWVSARYSLAALVTSVALAVIPCIVTLITGVLGVIVGGLLTVILPFGADPPLLGFASGISVVFISIVGTIAILLAIVMAAFLLNVAVLTPTALIIRFIFDRSHINSLALAAAVFLFVGLFLGLAIGALVHAAGTWAQWGIAQNPWSILSFYLISLTVGIAANAIYGSVLIFADAARAGIRYVKKLIEK